MPDPRMAPVVTSLKAMGAGTLPLVFTFPPSHPNKISEAELNAMQDVQNDLNAQTGRVRLPNDPNLAEEAGKALGKAAPVDSSRANVKDFARIRGPLTMQEADLQVQAYLQSAPPERRQVFQRAASEGIEYAVRVGLAKKDDKGHVSPVGAYIGAGLRLAGSKETTEDEKYLGRDLYHSALLHLAKQRITTAQA